MNLHLRLGILPAIQYGTRYLCTSIALMAKSHYDSLGITPQATQKDVKEAYYKLSKLYHPDKNKGSEEASDKFREVTEAYEVLGNVKLRKLYDRGASNIGRGQHFTKDDPSTGFYRSRDIRTRPPPPNGRTPIYDFDEWSRAHYESTFVRDLYYKRMVEKHRVKVERDRNDIKIERVLLAMGAMFVFCVYISYNAQNVDRVRFLGDISYTEEREDLKEK